MNTAIDQRRQQLTAEIAAQRALAMEVVDHLEPLLYHVAQEITRQAGLDRHCMSQHLHNAQVGSPWPGVDYTLVALADLWLHRLVYLPSRLANIMFELQCYIDPTYPEFARQCSERKLMEQRWLD